jgi:hypothetical protein
MAYDQMLTLGKAGRTDICCNHLQRLWQRKIKPDAFNPQVTHRKSFVTPLSLHRDSCLSCNMQRVGSPAGGRSSTQFQIPGDGVREVVGGR